MSIEVEAPNTMPETKVVPKQEGPGTFQAAPTALLESLHHLIQAVLGSSPGVYVTSHHPSSRFIHAFVILRCRFVFIVAAVQSISLSLPVAV